MQKRITCRVSANIINTQLFSHSLALNFDILVPAKIRNRRLAGSLTKNTRTFNLFAKRRRNRLMLPTFLRGDVDASKTTGRSSSSRGGITIVSFLFVFDTLVSAKIIKVDVSPRTLARTKCRQSLGENRRDVARLFVEAVAAKVVGM